MARPRSLTDEEILTRARAVFLEEGFAARTRQISAAVGLTWGAIALRFATKRALFARAMSAAAGSPGEAVALPDDDASLPCVLERLRCRLRQQWPLRLQCRLAASETGHDDEAEALLRALRTALESRARHGAIRSDMNAETLSRLVFALLIGDASQRFVAREPVSTDEAAFIDDVVLLLSVK